ncbi:MAG: aldo/keto reductase [Opitutae bacterium]|nr:aldo/keto reductase [Opitutae bacterium]
MKTRVLGRTGLNVSIVGVGTWQFGGEWGRSYTAADAREVLAAARDCGINLIDTAECYEDWIIATKWGHKFHECFKRDVRVSPADLREQLDASLKALRTDYVDLLQFHSGNDARFATPGMWAAAAEARRQGKVRFLGNSISSSTTDSTQVDCSTDVGVDVIQLVYNRLERGPEQTVLPSCVRQHLGVLARVPLASGFLSGKYKPGHQFPANDVREVWMKAKQDRMLREVEHIAATEVPAGVPMAQWALAWVLKNPAVTAVIPGCKDAAQVRANAAAVGLL